MSPPVTHPLHARVDTILVVAYVVVGLLVAIALGASYEMDVLARAMSGVTAPRAAASGYALPVSTAFNLGSAEKPYIVTVSDVALAFTNAEPFGPRATCWLRTMRLMALWRISGYAHVEFAFTVVPRGSDGGAEHSFYMGCRVVAGETVRLTHRRYNEQYEFFPLALDARRRDALFARCASDAQRNIPFNRRAFYTNFVLPRALRTDRAGAAYFCSEHVVTALRESGAVALPPDMRAYETTPQQLYDHLRAQRGFSQAVTGNLKVIRGDVALDV